jgi:hypothetical protein
MLKESRTMSYKTTYILFGLAVLLLGGFLIALRFTPEETKESSNYVVAGMHSKANPINEGNVDRVEIDRRKPENQAVKMAFVKDPETKRWRITEPGNFRADRFAVDGLIRQVQDAERDPNADKLTKLADAGLDSPSEVVTLSKGNQSVSLNVGDTGPGKEPVVYVTSSDDPNNIAVVKKSQIDSLFKPLNDFRDRDLLSPSPSDIQSVTLSQGKKGAVELKKAEQGTDRWVYVKPPYGRAEYTSAGTPPGPGKAPDSVNSLLTDVSDLKVDKPEDFVANDAKDLAKYNLDPAKGDVLRVAIDRTDEVNTSEEGKKERKTSHLVLLVGVGKKVDKADQYYACLEDDHNVVKVAANKVDSLLKLLADPGALRDRNLVDTSGFKKPDAIDIQNSYGKLEFRHTSGTTGVWKLYRGDQAQAVDEQAVQQLVDQLTKKNVVESFIDDPKERAPLGLDKPDVTVSIWLEGIAEDKEADKDKEKDKTKKKDARPKLKDPDKPSVVLRFGHRKERSVAVERQLAGESHGTVVLVPEKLLDQVREGPLAYLDRKVPSFGSPFDATRMVIERGSGTTAVAKEKTGTDWKIEKPAEQAGRKADAMAVEDILRDLSTLRAERLAAEKVEPAKLAQEYGLNPPATKVVVTWTKDNKPQTFEYDFGKDAGSNGVYLKVTGSDTVYVVNNMILTALGRELQDPSVFHFDVTKARELRLKGWKDLYGGDGGEWVLKRKDGGSWEVDKSKAVKLEPDQEKVRKFLDELSRLRAERFVAHNAKPASSQGLTLTQGALQVEVIVEGEKQPFELTVGNPDGDKGYFATSNRLAGDIFDVRKDIFEGPKGKAANLSK